MNLPEAYRFFGVGLQLEACVSYFELMQEMAEPDRARMAAEKGAELLLDVQDPEIVEKHIGEIVGLFARSGDWLPVFSLLTHLDVIKIPSRRNSAMLAVALALSSFPETRPWLAGLLPDLHPKSSPYDVAKVVQVRIALNDVERARALLRDTLVRAARQSEEEVLSFFQSCEEGIFHLEPDAYWSFPALLLEENRWKSIIHWDDDVQAFGS